MPTNRQTDGQVAIIYITRELKAVAADTMKPFCLKVKTTAICKCTMKYVQAL